MSEATQSQLSLITAAQRYWRDQAALHGRISATRALMNAFWEFLRDSTPSRLRQRFGDAEYDWDFRVNTTSGAVRWRERLLGNFYSAYQPTDQPSFREMILALRQHTNLDYSTFTFMDLGSGKGRTLLMASEYPFRRIIGVELLPSLHQIACENIAKYKSDSQRCFDLRSICADATQFPIPEDPVVIYLFNPFPEMPLREMLRNLETSLLAHPRPAYVLYYNPEHEQKLMQSTFLTKILGTPQYSIFVARR